MKKQSGEIADYKLLFELFDEGVAALDADVKIQYRESVEVSEEVEALRAITEQVNADAHGVHSLTLG